MDEIIRGGSRSSDGDDLPACPLNLAAGGGSAARAAPGALSVARDTPRNNPGRQRGFECLLRQEGNSECHRHTLEEGDEAKRLDFCLEMGNRVLNDVGFHKRILFSDESTFSTNGIVSSQHCLYWSETNPHFTISCRRQYFKKVNFNSEFNEHWIGRDGPILWPPRSPDLTILDFYLWGRLKQIVYREPLENDEEQLKTRIQNAVKSLSIEEIRNSFNEFRARIEICAVKGGTLFE
ncbi:hypothetical protein NQ318_015450 [Aromia moschata]|uniref:Transposable element Tc3 transposase n=1 Tax=Aromia moschata TaxID=1265417 RepID=A0AAV8X654_9CUCU|nr:hypothetical protein NQ318_015450 [Aromia moschata]